MIPKTRTEAQQGKRNKPHFYLSDKRSCLFTDVGKPPKKTKGTIWWKHIDKVMDFEERIDWSTWGRK